jgi:hypothetical protein
MFHGKGEMQMTYVSTLKRHLVFVGTAFPKSLIEATSHAVEVGAVEVRRGGMPSPHILQEVAACKPELLDWPTMLFTINGARHEQVGMLFLQGDTSALLLFRIEPEMASDREHQFLSLPGARSN